VLADMPLRTVLVAVTLLVACALPAAAQTSGSTQDRNFRIDWQPYALGRAAPSLEGYVYNGDRYRVGGVRLKIEALDASGNAIGETYGWVYGNIPSGGRSYFVVTAPRGAASYRLSIVSYHNVALEGP
jgi:hypothetical protein